VGLASHRAMGVPGGRSPLFPFPSLFAGFSQECVSRYGDSHVREELRGDEEIDDPFFRGWILRYAMPDSVPGDLSCRRCT